MSSNMASLPDGVELRSGKFYDDRWISSEIQLAFTNMPETFVFYLTLWNPDTSAGCHMNTVTVSCNDIIRVTDKIRMGQVVDISVEFAGASKGVLGIKVKHSIPGSQLDRRERAMKVVDVGWKD
ncbi:hypothetical protein [Roseovarius salis]|uniref:hypothetical protein n=1 Tax=Roseovarius salis TaxID=3376063 RepID=UPI0037C8C663